MPAKKLSTSSKVFANLSARLSTLRRLSSTASSFSFTSGATSIPMWILAATDTPVSIAIDGNNNIITVGTTGDIIVRKMNVNGNIIWTRQLATVYSEAPIRVVADTAGNIYIAGYTYAYSTNNANTDAFIIKLDSNGNTLWFRVLTGSGFDNTNGGVAVDSSGNVYIAGMTTSDTGHSNGVMFIAKYNASGVFQSIQKIYWPNAVNGQNVRGICTDSSGNVYITGDLNLSQAFIIKYNGGIIWQKILTQGLHYEIVEKGGYLYAAGNSGNYPAGAMLTKYDTAGNLIWNVKTSTDDNFNNFGIAISPDGNSIYLTGRVGPPKFITLKFSSSGTLLSQQIISRTGTNGQGYDVVVDSTGSVYSCGGAGFSVITKTSNTGLLKEGVYNLFGSYAVNVYNSSYTSSSFSNPISATSGFTATSSVLSSSASYTITNTANNTISTGLIIV